jgi:formimidoylglutamate deiminase
MQYILAKQLLTPNGWAQDVQVGINPDGKIGSVGPKTTSDSRTVDLLLPAPVNLHSHTFQRAMSGLTEARGPNPSDSFWTWRRMMYRFLDQLSPEHIETIATLAFMEMLEAGYAGVCEFHYLHHTVGGKPYANLPELGQRIINAAQTAGIGLTLLPVLYQFGGCDQRPLQGGQLRFKNDPDRFAQLFADSKTAIEGSAKDYAIGVAPHSLRAVNTDGLRMATDLYPSGPLHMHLAEQQAEVTEVEACYGTRPVNYLLDNYDINTRHCLIHCTQMTEIETNRLAKTGAVAGLCPLTESNLGDGIFSGTTYRSAGGRFGMGSDANTHITLFEELKTLEYSQRLRDHSRAAFATQNRSTGRLLLDHALQGGAQAAARNSGAIQQGMLADLIAVETDNPWLCNRQGDTALDCLIFGGNGQSGITDVWAAGRHMVKQGQHVHRQAITQNFIKTITDLGQHI